MDDPLDVVVLSSSELLVELRVWPPFVLPRVRLSVSVVELLVELVEV